MNNVNDFASPFPHLFRSDHGTLELQLDQHRQILVSDNAEAFEDLSFPQLRAAFTAAYLLGAAHGAMMSKTGGGQ